MTTRRDDQAMTRLAENLAAYPLPERAEQDEVVLPSTPDRPVQGAPAEDGRQHGDVELVGQGEQNPTHSQPAALSLFGVSDPIAIIEQASRVATALKDVIVRQKLYQPIKSTNKKTGLVTTRNYVTVEGWTLLGSMLGVFAHIEWTRRIKGAGADYSKDGWEARASAIVAASGNVIGVGEAQCTREESMWSGRDDYALRAMAQTRAISRTLRAPLGFVIKLAGFEATGAEEMPST